MKNDINKYLNKNEWIDQVINSTKGIQPAQPPTDAFERILIKINNPAKPRTVTFPVNKWAAAAILLLALNISSAVYAIEQNRKKTFANKTSPIAAEIQLESTYNY